MRACRDSGLAFWQAGSSFVIDLAGQSELIAVGVLEDGNRSPLFILWFLGEGDAFGLQHFGGGEDVVTPEGNGLELADALLVTLGRLKGDARLRSGNEELNPPLRVCERLVGDHFQSQRLGVEVQRNVLIANRNAYELYSPNHK